MVQLDINVARSARHGRQNDHRILRADRGIEPLKVLDVLIVDEDVHEALQLIVLEQTIAQGWIAICEVTQHLADRLTLGLYLLFATCLVTKHGWNAHGAHIYNPSL